MTQHILKLNDRYFDAVANGIKTFEIRKNDRDYKVGDTLILRKVNDDGKFLTYADHNLGLNLYYEIKVAVTYILTHDEFDGIREGYVALGIRRMGE